MIEQLTKKIYSITSVYQKHQSYGDATFFVGGFLFDLTTLDKIEGTNLLQQGLFLVLLSLFIFFDVMFIHKKIEIPEKYIKFWKYRNEFGHFIFGSLLSAYTIFFFKSASISTSLSFLIGLVFLLVLNEFPKFKKQGHSIRILLFNFCLIAFLIYLVPIFFGRLGTDVFIVSIFSSQIYFASFLWIWRKYHISHDFLKKQFLFSIFVHIAIVILFFSNSLPPVPVSIRFIGIYHDIKKSNDKYELLYDRPFWKFWQSGDQSFFAQPGDKIVCFAKIHSPTHFNDEVFFKWELFTEKFGWQTQDYIQMNILGGRKKGYRGFTTKSNYQPGHWRIKLETSDHREIGRIDFQVIKEDSQSDRKFKSEIF